MMTYTTEEAATFLKMSVSNVNYHRGQKNLIGIKRGGVRFFSQEELDYFNKHRRPSHRPPQQIERVKKALNESGVDGKVIVKRGRFVHIVQDGEIIRLDNAPSRMSIKGMVKNIKRLSKI